MAVHPLPDRTVAKGAAAAALAPDDQDAAWMALVAASERLAGARSMEAIIGILRETARQVAGAMGIAVVIREEDRCFYAAEDAAVPLWAGQRFPAASCVSGWAMMHRQTVEIPDITQDARVPHALYTAARIRALVMVPIGAPEPFAALGAYWQPGQRADPRAAMRLEALARSAAIAFENVRLLRSAQRSDRLQRMAVTAGRMGVWTLDLQGGDLASSATCRENFGRDPAVDFPYAALREAIHPEDRAAVDAAMAGSLRSGGDYDIEYRVLTPSGDIRWIGLRGQPAYAADGAAVSLSGVSVDITERRQAEAQREQLNQLLESRANATAAERDSLWNASEDLLAIAGPDGALLRGSPGWGRLLGLAPAALRGVPLVALAVPGDAPALAEALARLREGRSPVRCEARLAHAAGGFRWIAWTLVALPAEEGEAEAELPRLFAVGRDVTAEHAAAETRHQLEEQLRQSQKMEAVGQLTGGLAHDFNNLLTGISGNLELLEMRVAQGRVTELDRYIERARAASARAAALTHRLLAFSRRQTLDPKPTEVNRLVAGMADLLRNTAGPAIAVDWRPDPALWPVLVDPSQLENALLNLCINARDAMPDGGSLVIETLNAGGAVVLQVTDSGGGMTPEVLARAFDPFFTTKPLGQGTGLGLSMIYGFVRQSGGDIRITSSPGQGTCVRLELPRHTPVLRAELPAPEAGPLPEAEQGSTILVVDDEGVVRAMVVEVLQEQGYACLEAEEGASALEILRSPARIDLLLTDVGLPGGMNGRQVADAARQLRPELKVLFITGYAENAALGGGQIEPGMQVLTKPFTVDRLVGRVQVLLG
ncbi:PAS domain-containing protein [Roseomonas sp. 18066]|uniref:PAS domain-containing protein n=1 Tax=Roseomonas sp. 18066 TaxID=2681412 RepID=UPI00190FA496|nr:PAS domain-containing protein [Roseomonas sp. 18066]